MDAVDRPHPEQQRSCGAIDGIVQRQGRFLDVCIGGRTRQQRRHVHYGLDSLRRRQSNGKTSGHGPPVDQCRRSRRVLSNDHVVKRLDPHRQAFSPCSNRPLSDRLQPRKCPRTPSLLRLHCACGPIFNSRPLKGLQNYFCPIIATLEELNRYAWRRRAPSR